MKCCIYNRSLPKWILAACCYNKFWNIKVCHCTFSVLSVNRKLPPRLKTALRNSALNRHWSDICLHLVSLGSSKLQFELWVDPDTAGLICRYRMSFLDCTHTSFFFLLFFIPVLYIPQSYFKHVPNCFDKYQFLGYGLLLCLLNES